MKVLNLAAIATLCLALLPLPALAHKVIAAVYPSGAQIEGEIGFSSGDMAENALIIVLDPAGRKLGQTVTDGNGMFTFAPTEVADHVFRADLGAGHVANVTMKADAVARILGQAKAADTAAFVPQPEADVPAAPSAVAAFDPELIASIVRDEMRPLRQEIAAYKEKNDLQTILGGIGYIAGVFGLAFYIAARRRLGAR